MVIRRKEGDLVQYKIANPGRQLLEKVENPTAIEVIYVEPGKRWTAKNKLGELSKSLKGELLISDRYFGQRTAHILAELLVTNPRIRFMTSETSENFGKMKNNFEDLIKENKGLKMRIYPTKSELHDRYILCENALVIIGHGLKDLGGRESFVVRLGSDAVGDTMNSLRKNFEERWVKSSKI